MLHLKDNKTNENELTSKSRELGVNDNGGLVLKRDQGFQYLSVVEKAFVVCFLYDEHNKAKAFAKAIGLDFESLAPIDKQNLRIKSETVWKDIENKLGGVRNIITLMGVDVVTITRHAVRLLSTKKMALDKDGVEHYSDDGATQVKALEFLSKLSGNYSEEIENTNKTSININFGASRPAKPEDIESDNMEVIIGSSERID